MIKKSATLFFISFVFVGTYLFLTKEKIIETESKPKLEDAFIETEQSWTKEKDDYNNFYLLFDEVELTTRNFYGILNNNFEIKEIYPYINPLYENRFRIKKYVFNSSESSLSSFFKLYRDNLKDLTLDEEITKIDVYGIKIRLVLSHVKNEEMLKLLEAYPNIKYSFDNNKFYKI